MALVVDASVGLKWILQESDSNLAHSLPASNEELFVPDFWLNEACNVLWLQVRKAVFTPAEAREALVLLQSQIEPTATAGMDLHGLALDIGFTANHSPYNTLYLPSPSPRGHERLWWQIIN